ncbi:MAG: hypothetical protein ACK4E8_08575 [Lacibacter sp.]
MLLTSVVSEPLTISSPFELRLMVPGPPNIALLPVILNFPQIGVVFCCVINAPSSTIIPSLKSLMPAEVKIIEPDDRTINLPLNIVGVFAPIDKLMVSIIKLGVVVPEKYVMLSV